MQHLPVADTSRELVAETNKTPNAFQKVNRFVALQIIKDYIDTARNDRFALLAMPALFVAVPTALAIGYGAIVLDRLYQVASLMVQATYYFTIKPFVKNRTVRRIVAKLEKALFCGPLGGYDDAR